MTAIELEIPITLTDSAITEVKRLMNASDFDHSQFLRVGVKGGGCSGLSYLLGFDKKEEDDQLYTFADIQVLVKKSHGIYLYGMQVDFEHGLNARGFTFKNPNASSTCGCGTSFAV
ncbi:MAG: iron-sulfur cluster assembly accessory protein [Bacteroidetes bacterium]|nr:iron-sulfur cluster assembly accessory protein [Bacteroidota bacterium]